MSKIETFTVNGNVFEFKMQDDLGRPEDEVYKSLRVIPANCVGAHQPLNFKNSNYYIRRGWLNAALDGLIRETYEFSMGNRLAMYRVRDEDRRNGGMGWGWFTLFGAPDDGIWGTRRLGDTVYDFVWPSRKDEKGIKQPLPLTKWVFIRQRSRLEFALENTWKDAKTGESAAELKHNALNELLDGVSVVVPCTIGVMQNGDRAGELLDGEQNIAKLIKKELALLESGETQEALRDAEFLRRSAYKQGKSLDTKIETQTELKEEAGVAPTPEPESGYKVRVDGHSRKLENLETGYYKVWPLTTDGKRMRAPEFSSLKLQAKSARAINFAHPEAYDLELLPF